MQVFVNLQQINVNVCLGLQPKHSVNEAAVRPLALSVPPPDQVYMPGGLAGGLGHEKTCFLLGKMTFSQKNRSFYLVFEHPMCLLCW